MKSLSPTGRLRLVSILNIRAKAKPTRRVWIPKPGTDEKRPLGIPVMHDRATQALVKLALEPEWEARFEPNSYGFRPGRSAHDAQTAIHTAINRRPKHVLDADIAKCFDRINHEALLKKLGTSPTLRRVIKGWLTAGVMDGPNLFPTTEGTPQGGVVSPLLANIALHGLETAIESAFPHDKYVNGKQIEWYPRVIRYADDFVILHEDRGVIEQAQQITNTWLKDMGLELKPSKTRITHTLRPTAEGNVGFDFLGWEFRQHPAGRTHSGKGTRGALLGFTTVIRPSKDAQARHQAKLGEVIRNYRSGTQSGLIGKLNPIIRGWVNYHHIGASKEVFGRMQSLLWYKLWRWARRRHPKKSRAWIAEKYWHPSTGQWRFADADGGYLYRHNHKKGTIHVKVTGARSPYDGDWAYWGQRLGRYPDLKESVAKLLKQQKGRCTWCGLYFTSEDIRENDHLLPKTLGGGDEYKNRQLLHGHCHDEKTALDGSSAARGAHDKGLDG
jgi:RNA-directed DNA polymerase